MKMNSIKLFSLITVFVLTTACNSGNTEKPSGAYKAPEGAESKIELIASVAMDVQYPTPIGFIETENTENIYYLTLDNPQIISVNLTLDEIDTTELVGGENMVVISYAYNASSGQLLVQMTSKDSATSIQVDSVIAAYTLDGKKQWEKECANYISFVSFGDNWCYLDGANLCIVDSRWNMVKLITLPSKNYSINRITDDGIFLFENITNEGSTSWYSVSIDWEGNILDKEATLAFYNPCLLSEGNDRYVIANNENGELVVYEQSETGINKQITIVHFSSEACSFTPTAAVAKDEYNYVFGTMTETDDETADEGNAYLLQLDRNWNFIDACEIPIEDNKKIIGAFVRENRLLISVCENGVSSIIGTISSGQQLFEVYNVIL